MIRHAFRIVTAAAFIVCAALLARVASGQFLPIVDAIKSVL